MAYQLNHATFNGLALDSVMPMEVHTVFFQYLRDPMPPIHIVLMLFPLQEHHNHFGMETMARRAPKTFEIFL